MAVLSIVILLTNQIGADLGFEKNFLPIPNATLAQDPPTFYRFGLNLGLGYSYYEYYPYSGEKPYLPDLRLSVSYRFFEGKTFNPLMRGVFSLALNGRVGIYPKQTGTDGHIPYFAAGITLGLLDESLIFPKISIKTLGTRVRNLAVLPDDPYYRIEIDRSDAINTGLEMKKIIGNFDVTITPTYLYAKIKGNYRSYSGPEQPEELDGTEITKINYDSSISRYGVTFMLGLRRFSLSTGYLTNWQIGLNYRLAG